MPGGLIGLDLGGHVIPPSENSVLAVEAKTIDGNRHVVSRRGLTRPRSNSPRLMWMTLFATATMIFPSAFG